MAGEREEQEEAEEEDKEEEAGVALPPARVRGGWRWMGPPRRRRRC